MRGIKVLRRWMGSICVALVALMLFSSTVLAGTYDYYSPITIFNNSSTAYTVLPILVTVNNTQLVNLGYINTTGLDTDINEAGVSKPSALVNGTVGFVLDNVTAHQARNLIYSMSYDPARTTFPIIPGYGGYITTVDATSANMEPGNNFTIDIDGYFNTSTSANVLSKASALTIATGSGNITATMYTGGAPSTLSVTASSIPSGVHSLRVAANTTYFAIYVDDMVTPKGTISQILTATGNSTLAINGDGTATGIAVVTGAATHWEAVQTSDDDTSYVHTVSTTYESDYYTIGAPSPALPAGASITYIAVGIGIKSAGGVWVYATPGLRLVGQDSNGAEASSSTQGYVNHVGNVTRPGGGSWAISDLDTLETILRIKTSNPAGPIRCTYTYNTVYYTYPSVASVPNNGNNWVWMDSNTMSYATSIKEYVNSTLKMDYAPNSMILGTNLPDLSVSGNSGVVTWGTNPAGIEVTLGGVLTTDTYSSPGGSSVTPPPVLPVPAGINIFGTPGAVQTDWFMYPSISKMAASLGWGVDVTYSLIELGIAMMLAFAVLMAVPNWWYWLITFGITFGAFTASGECAPWVNLLIIGFTIFVAYLFSRT